MKLAPWEVLVLGIVQAAAPTVENLFIHSARGIAIFNASDNLFNNILGALAAGQTPVPTPAPAPVQPAA